MRLFGRKDEAEPSRLSGIARILGVVGGARPRAGRDGRPAETRAAGRPDRARGSARASRPGLGDHPGRSAAHALVVTAAGDAELRPLAHRWARAAPPADLLWEFHPSRPANPQAAELTLDVAAASSGWTGWCWGCGCRPEAPRAST